MLQIYHVSTLYPGILMAKCSYCIVGALRRRYFPYGEITGRMISVMLLSDRPRRSLDFDSLRGAPPYAVCATELPGWIFLGVHLVFYAIAVDEPIIVHVVRSDGFISWPQLDIYSEYQDFYCINIHLAFGLIHRIHEYTQRF